MSAQLWIGFGFLTGLVIFLMLSFFLSPQLTNDQRATLKFLTALCAGLAGGFITGGSLFEGSWTTPSSKIALSGTAGFALFFLVWMSYPKVFAIPDAVAFSIPAGWTFRDTADAVLANEKAVADYRGFTAAELSAGLKPNRLETKTTTEALMSLRLLTTVPGSVREYDVVASGSIYQLTVRKQ
jgi:hypothetical protein